MAVQNPVLLGTGIVEGPAEGLTTDPVVVTMSRAIAADTPVFVGVSAVYGATEMTAPTISGGGVTWDLDERGDAEYRPSGSIRGHFWLFRGSGSAPAGATITITPSSPVAAASAHVVEVPGARPGNAGGDAILQIDGAVATQAVGVSMSTAASADNAFLVFGAYVRASPTRTFETDPAWTELAETTAAHPAGTLGTAVQSQYILGLTATDPQVGFQLSGTADAALALALEIAAADGGGDPPDPNERPATPSITASATGETTASLSSSAFSDPDSGQTHTASQWQVTLSADTGFNSPVFDSGTDTSNLLSRSVTGLVAGTQYRARVRHRDSSGVSATEWSLWSSAATFATSGQAAVLGALNLPTTSALASTAATQSNIGTATTLGYKLLLQGGLLRGFLAGGNDLLHLGPSSDIRLVFAGLQSDGVITLALSGDRASNPAPVTVDVSAAQIDPEDWYAVIGVAGPGGCSLRLLDATGDELGVGTAGPATLQYAGTGNGHVRIGEVMAPLRPGVPGRIGGLAVYNQAPPNTFAAPHPSDAGILWGVLDNSGQIVSGATELSELTGGAAWEASDDPWSADGGTPPPPPLNAGTVVASASSSSVTIAQGTPPSGGEGPPYTRNLYRSTTSGQRGTLRQSSVTLPFNDTQVTNGTTYYYTLQVGDGETTADTPQVSATPTTQNTAPVVSITAPSASSITVSAGTVIRVEGTAHDAEDGNLAATVDVTSSNTSDGTGGDLGTGLPININTAGWGQGTRTISVTAVDSGSLQGSDSFQLTIGQGGGGTSEPDYFAARAIVAPLGGF